MSKLLEFCCFLLDCSRVGSKRAVVQRCVGGGEEEVILAHSLAKGSFACHFGFEMNTVG